MGALFPILWWHTFEDSPYSLRNVFQAFYKNEYDRINELYFKCSLASCISKLSRDWIRLLETVIESGSKYTFLKTWNSLLNDNSSLNYSFISWFFSPFKSLRVILTNANHPTIIYGKTLRLNSLSNVKIEYLILSIDF